MGYNKRIKAQMRKMEKGRIPEYSFGGWVKENSQGLLGGLKSLGGAALMATGVGSPLGIGLLTSGIGDVAGELTDGNQGDQEKMLERQRQLLTKQEQFAARDTIPGQNSYTQLMPYGGQTGSDTVELEKGEPYMLPDGTIESIPTNAPTHKRGGVKITLPNGTKVLGKKEAMNGKEFKDMGRKLQSYQKRYDKSLEEKPTSLTTRTAKRMLDNINTEYNKLFQEQGEDIGTGKRFGKGGKVKKYPEGGEMGMEPWMTDLNQGWYGSEETSTTTAPIATGSGFDWENALGTAGALSPMLYNLYQGSQPADNWNAKDFRNPYAEGSRKLMRDRKYNVKPELEAAERSSATYRRKLKESGLSKGQLMGGYQAASLEETRNKGRALATKQNIENQYRGEQAQFDYGVGQDISQRRMAIKDINARNEATKRGMTAQGFSQLGQYSQMQQLQRNQKLRDKQRLDLLPSLIQQFLYNEDSGFDFINK